MAVITTEGRNELTALYVAMFNVAPGSDSLSSMVAAAEGNKTLLQIATDLATKTSFSTSYPGFLTGQEFADRVVSRLLPSTTPAAAITFGTNWVLSALNAGKSRAQVITEAVQALRATTNTNYTDAKAQLANKVDVSLYSAITKAQTADSASAIGSVTKDAASVTAAKTTLDSTVFGATFQLTTGTDNLVGDGNSNTFAGSATTLTSGDKIDGGAGTDTFDVTVTGTAPAFTLTAVEVVDITASPNPATVDLNGSTGITTINNDKSANGATLTVNNVGNVVNSSLTGSQASTTINYTTAAVAGTADAATLTLSSVAAGSSFTSNGVETMTVASTTAANTLGTLTNSALKTLKITGDQALTITNSVGGITIGAVNASAATGAIKLTTGGGAGGATLTGVTVTGPTATGSIDVTTGGNKDTVTLGSGNNTVNTGAGNDTITSGAGTNTIVPGAGNDTITLSGGTDTIRFGEAGSANADSINGFSTKSVLALVAGGASTATAAATAGTFGVVQTGATAPSLPGVGGTGTGTAVVLQAVNPNATATVGTVAAGSTVVALNGAFTDGTAAGVVNALGTTATTGITTTTSGKFVLVTYSVGNIAQIWSYGGDTTTANTDIDAAELSLVATLSGVAQNSITAANFATYITPAASTTTVVNTGQTINLSGTLNTVQNTANAAGQFLTAGDDTINVGVGTLPTAAATATSGLTIIDSGVGDADVMNATVLGDWAAGSIVSGIETINLNMLVAGITFSAAAKTPGTTQFGLTGSQNFTATAMPNSSGVTLNSGYTGTADIALASVAGTADTIVINLNGSTATSATAGGMVTSSSGAGVETATVNVNAASAVRMSGAGIFSAVAGDVAAVNLAGSGGLTVWGTAANLDTMILNGSGVAYSGALSVRPTTNANMDFSSGGVVTGIRTIDLSSISGFSSTITLAQNNNSAAYGTGAVTIANNPLVGATATFGAHTIALAGGDLTNAVTYSSNSGVTTYGAITATSIETLNIVSGALSTATLTLGNITLADGAGTQTIKVTAGSTVAAGTFTADTVDFTAVTGAVTGLTLANTAGAAFSGGAGNTTVAGSAQADVINTGVGADTITGNAGDDNINSGAGGDTVTGGAGVDTINLGAGDGVADTVVLTGIVAVANRDVVSSFVTGTDKITVSAAQTTLETAAGAAPVSFLSTTAAAAGGGTYTPSAAAATADVLRLTVSAVTANGDLSAATDGTQLLRALTEATVTGDTYTGIVTANADIGYIMTTQAGTTYLYYYAETGNNALIGAAEIHLVGTFVGVTVAIGDFNNLVA